MELVRLVQSTPTELEELIKQSLKSQLEGIKKDFSESNQGDKILSKEETAKFLKVNKSTIYRWTKGGRLKAYGVGNRVYYYMSDIMKALIPIN